MALQEKLRKGKFVVLGEFEPPKGADFSNLMENAGLVRGRVDAIVVPEMANAVLKASSLGASAFLLNHGIEPVFQVSCRDRNRLALQADLLSAGALGIKNVMAVSGADITYGDHPQTRVVNDLSHLELVETIHRLQEGKDLAGIELRGVPRFCVGTTIDTGASGGLFNIELENLEKQLELGVDFVVTRPVFDLHRFQQILKRMETGKVPLIPTVLVLKSAGMARYIDRNIRGLSVPSEMISSIQKAPDRIQECIRIAADLITRLKEMGLAGILVSTMGWEDKLPQILDEAKL
ncbi:MAG: methylenetetrahydrofolate reductase [Deltaproteobacteria bacterium]|nr:methylenetetrahydrofolate reductase [Deltaproteobacteria bacterium]MBW2015354.1 methylenetetrahydrofolate reductase [Deltaproteobacteria bacterium]MBW2303068.1 methylenetetrahydrofolate reductase [Deltaproteobacteria bacterium]